jgi:phosphopantetheinyl transferase (holo-ACP synthase)
MLAMLTRISHLASLAAHGSFRNTDLPLDLRYKKTRAIRRRLTTKEQSAITVKQHKKNIHFPARRFALKA